MQGGVKEMELCSLIIVRESGNVAVSGSKLGNGKNKIKRPNIGMATWDKLIKSKKITLHASTRPTLSIVV